MKNFHLFWEHSPAWLLLILALSALASWFIYSRPADWSASVRWSLFGIRTLFLFLLASLLLNPLIRKFKETSLPPVSVILVDNSASVPLGSSPDSLQRFGSGLKELKAKLEKAGSRVFVTGLAGNLNADSAIRYSANETSLEPAFRRIREEFENQNLAQVILASDGIINKGSDLAGSTFDFRINTILLGNPVPRKDLRINEVRTNKVAFLGNSFPISVLVSGKKIGNEPVRISVSEGGKVIENKTVSLSSNGLATVDFSIRPQSKGIRQYKIEVAPLAGEVTLQNNSKTIFVEVVDSKQKVLLVAAAPHPDIKAIRSALAPLEQIELTTIIGGVDSWKQDAWNLVILHQLPDRSNTFSTQVSALLKGNSTSVWLISTGQTDVNKLRQDAGSWLSFQGFGAGSDEVSGAFSDDFQRFVFEDKWKKVFSDLPPIKSPGMSYSWKSPSETVLVQKLGRVISPTPLLSLQVDGAVKRAIFWGDGLWLWRLNEFAKNENSNAIDNLIGKTVQLLLSAEKKKHLRVILNNSELVEGEQAGFGIETYNQLFEPVYDQKIGIQVSRTDGWKENYSFVNAVGNAIFRTPSLQPGAYHYKATAVINGKPETDEGDFIVRTNDLEAQELEANHRMLTELAVSNQGKAVGIASMESLVAAGELPKPLIEFTDWDENILSMWWILVLLILLLSTEWAVRKWNGVL